MFKNSAEIFDYIKKNDVKLIDVRFIDLPGIQHHFNVPVESFDESVFKDGLMFDGSSIRGFQSIHESDMKLLPVPSSAYLDPFRKEKTLIILFSVHNPDDNTAFYVFDRIRFLTGMNQAFHHIDSYEGAWNTGIEEDADGTPNRGYRTRIKGGYFPVSPTDQFADLRDEMVMNLGKVGLLVERAHHEVGTAGQMEINYRFSDILTAGDELMKFKYIIKNTAWAAGKTATFMPKPLFGDNGSGMHVHQSLWKDGKPLFWGDGYANLSDTARWYIGGLLKHAPSLLAFTNPTVNSYKRLVPGYEAPVNLVYSARNRSACIRIPITGSNPKAKRIEFRCPDPSSNPYLAFAAMLMAGIDGIQNKIEPPKPVDKDLYELEGDEAKAIPQVPGSLDAVLDNLERDNEFLTRGGVFTKDLIETWIDFKRKQEVDYVRLRPHPAEFELYYDL
ncbi:MAG: type I glutamate--ammonia ligase [Actinobacteria bacterium]|nr:type I glutamate--ammonia ligase [Actinomycetota bacterium]